MFRNLQAPLCGIFYPHSVAVARYAALIRIKSPTNWDSQLTKSLFQTRYWQSMGHGGEHGSGKHGDGNRGKTERIGKMSEYVNVVEIFGENVFNDAVMQARLPKKVYKELKQTMEEGKELTLEIADVVAHEMKEWAIEKGATHYTHWFQPLTGVTAEKHDSFITAPNAARKGTDELFRKRADQG